MSETTPQNSEIDGPALQSSLLRDFYLSYRFSQGNPHTQNLLFTGLKSYYDHTLSDGELKFIEERTDDLLDRIKKLYPPKNHRLVLVEDDNDETKDHYETVQERDYKSEFSQQGEVFTKILRSAGGHYEFGTTVFTRELLAETIDSDTIFQRMARGYNPEDPHQSYYREFILLGNSTGSESFDYIYSAIRNPEVLNEVLADTSDPGRGSILETIEELSVMWESNHPGLQFAPA